MVVEVSSKIENRKKEKLRYKKNKNKKVEKSENLKKKKYSRKFCSDLVLCCFSFASSLLFPSIRTKSLINKGRDFG